VLIEDKTIGVRLSDKGQLERRVSEDDELTLSDELCVEDR
ncbi:hypothetical protein A2U01_0103878, partial [Trifolium medium]|nr:hypothetical protein [Trifolium medium]